MPSFFCLPLACNRQVDYLDRSSSKLESVPHEIFRYRGLEELILSFNNIKDLPKELFRLHRLRTLDISDNDVATLPPEIGNLILLNDLNLNRNSITDIPDQIKNCKQLVTLNLSGNLFTRIPESLCECTSVMSLSLNEATLTSLPANIGELVNLRVLEARENHLRSLPMSIVKLKKLEELDLGQNDIEELPRDFGQLENLRELYMDTNGLSELPDSITKCRKLDVVDVSDNQINNLPRDMGDMEGLTDLNVSQNSLQELPASIGRLRKLSIVKADRNTLTELPLEIGNCDSLSEFYLTSNNLSDLPPTIGNLKKLNTLNVDKNLLEVLPEEIGECSSLSLLSLRENQLVQLPMAIGKCYNLTILDVAANKLAHLPFTINVLVNLKALWLSENQTHALLKLTQDRDNRGVKVLTCYLLPQHSYNDFGRSEAERNANRQFMGGPKVHFPDQTDTTLDEERGPIGQFERHNTPHPKPSKLKKNSIDGHMIHHAETDQPRSFSLSSGKSPTTSQDNASFDSPASPTIVPPAPAPRSALKAYNPTTAPQPVLNRSFEENAARNRGDDTVTSQVSAVSDQNTSNPQKTIIIHKDNSGKLGLTFAGGPGNDPAPCSNGNPGLFVTKVLPGSVAERSGLRVGDKLIRANDHNMINASQEEAMAAIASSASAPTVELVVLRLSSASRMMSSSTSLQTISQNGARQSSSRESISALQYGAPTSTSRQDLSMQSPIQAASIPHHSQQTTTIGGGVSTESSLNGLYAERSSQNSVRESDEEVERVPEKTTHRQVETIIDDVVLPLTSAIEQLDLDHPPLATSSPLPAAIPASLIPKKVPPPVAPKPVRPPVPPQPAKDEHVFPVVQSETPERLTFQSKLDKFKAIDTKSTSSILNTSQSSLPPPEKKPLLSQQDMQKLREEENRKFANGHVLSGLELSPEKQSFEHLLDNSPLPRQPSVIRTKKAENRAIAAGFVSTNEEYDDEEKRKRWRADRQKSLEARSAEADALMERLKMATPVLSSIGENVPLLIEEKPKETYSDVTKSTEILFADE